MITKEKLEELYLAENMTQQAIANIYGCDRKNICYYLNKFGISKPLKGSYPIFDVNKALEMIRSGMLLNDVHKELGISRRCLSRTLNALGHNFKNWEGQRKKQSEMLKVNNPIDAEIRAKAVAKAAIIRSAFYDAECETFDENMTFKMYARKARYISYKKMCHLLNDGYSIDHMYSVSDGYKNKIPLSIISSDFNLRVIEDELNREKSNKSVIVLDELLSQRFNDYPLRE